jgi:hypothetical protein
MFYERVGVGSIVLIYLSVNYFYSIGRFKMEQNTNKIKGHGDTKKLSFVIVFLSLFVIALFGFAPLA